MVYGAPSTKSSDFFISRESIELGGELTLVVDLWEEVANFQILGGLLLYRVAAILKNSEKWNLLELA